MENPDLDIKNLDFTSEDTGYFYPKTYTEYNWKFNLDGINRNISLYHSKILGRRTIYLGNREICRYQRYTYNFHYSFSIDVHTISITQGDDTYILKIDGIPFNKLLNEQKLSRFNIIREIFSDKNDKNIKLGIKPLMTYKGARGNMVISNRTGNSKRDFYKTNIYSSKRENDIENDKNIINTSSKRTDNTIDTNINSDYYYSYNNYDEESSENLSNKAIDGGDSQRDEDDDEDNNQVDEDNNIKENNLDDDLFKTGNDFEDNNIDDENEEEIEEEKLDEDDNKGKDNINNIENKNDKDDSSDEEDDEEKNKINTNFNNINNELMPIKSKKEKKENKEKKIKKNSNNKKQKKEKKKKSNNYNYDEDDIYNINNEDNIDNENILDNENNINNENHIDLLGEEIYNSSRDKDKYNNNNIDNNFNINYFISQQNI